MPPQFTLTGIKRHPSTFLAHATAVNGGFSVILRNWNCKWLYRENIVPTYLVTIAPNQERAAVWYRYSKYYFLQHSLLKNQVDLCWLPIKTRMLWSSSCDWVLQVGQDWRAEDGNGDGGRVALKRARVPPSHLKRAPEKDLLSDNYQHYGWPTIAISYQTTN